MPERARAAAGRRGALVGQQDARLGQAVVGVPLTLGQHCLAPFLSEFLGRYPELALELTVVNHVEDPLAAIVDVLLAIWWPREIDLVAKRIAQTRLITCASPAYWDLHGRPQDPDELGRHACVALRLPGERAVLDLWRYRRGDETRSVPVAPRIVSDNHFWNFEAAARGLAVVRCLDLTVRPLLEQGVLEPVLEEWEALEEPAVYVMYRRGVRSAARVRAFVEFVTELFARLEATQPGAGRKEPRAISPPGWRRSKWVGSLTRRAKVSPARR